MKENVLTILIPVYNEEKTILNILRRTTDLNIDNYEVIVVDDCSKDKSLEIIEKFKNNYSSKNCKLKVVKHSKNMGKGSGIRTALEHANSRYFVVQDADLEYDPKDIERMIKIAKKNDYEVLYGSRFMGDIKTMPRANYIANKIYNILLRFLYETNVTDMHTCYKMIKTKRIKSFALTSSGFEYATEMIGNILSRGIPVHEVPISFNGRTKKEGKKIDYKDGIVCAKQIITDYLKFKGYYGELLVFLKFLVVGSVGFIVNYLIIVLVQDYLDVGSITVSSILSTFVALNVTFILHDKWTYKSSTYERMESKSTTSRYVSYLLSSLMGAVLTVVVIVVMTEVFKVDRIVAVITGAMAAFMWNYLVNKIFIWKIVPDHIINMKKNKIK